MSAELSIVATLIVYKIVLLGVGAWASRRSTDGSDFYLGGRRLGPWVASLSSAASSSSAWTLLGVSGAAYVKGLSAFWLMPACVLGFAFNWFFVAGRLRRLGAQCGALTLTELLAHDARGSMRRLLVVCASVIVLLSLGVYVASQFQAAGKTFAEALDIGPVAAVSLGGAIVLIYTMSGGFWAVSVTDLLQGLVMAAAAIVVPVAALVEVGGFAAMLEGLRAIDPALLDPMAGKIGFALVGFLAGTIGIGLGYPGQPHVVNRFMAMRNASDVRAGTVISLVWALIIYNGMLIAGWCGRVLVHSMGDHEALFIRLSTDLFPPVVAGVIVAAVLSAIMSTADSQLLVCGASVAHDLPARGASKRVLVDRLAVVAIGIAALVAALSVQETIFNSVLFAWSALGAAFGPWLLARLWIGPVSERWALVSMLTGFVVTLVWYFTPELKGAIYELVPAFAAATVPALLGAREGPKRSTAGAATS